ncbi:MAG: discoidin domain-containing protein [Flavobacterium sp.]
MINNSLKWYIDNGVLPPIGYVPSYDLIPPLRSSKQDGYVVTCSSIYSEIGEAFRAFDQNGSTRWMSSSSSVSEYIQIEFPRIVYINRVLIDQFQDSYGVFKDYTITTSLDGITFKNVYTGCHPNAYVAEIADFTPSESKFLKIRFDHHYVNMVTISQIIVGGFLKN